VQLSFGLSTNGWSGWMISFSPMNYNANDNLDNPHYPIDVAVQLDIGLYSGEFNPNIVISTYY
jgi:hypothetical protein